MKKIVALVLSLAMVLGLATTAFGANAIVINSPINAPEGYAIDKLPDGTLIAVPPADVVTETPAADTTVESAKTFDAGVATYVAMSLAAVTGSAVVLKKKD